MKTVPSTSYTESPENELLYCVLGYLVGIAGLVIARLPVRYYDSSVGLFSSIFVLFCWFEQHIEKVLPLRTHACARVGYR